MTTHTPGPWAVWAEGDIEFPEGAEGTFEGLFISAGTGPEVETLAVVVGDNREENACLIAAAPEMHSILTEFLCDQETLKPPFRNEALCEKARELLARLERED